MQYFYKDNQADDLIVFFTGWGCDYNQFTNLHDKDDVLILYDYQDLTLDLDFDFNKYANIYVIAYSAGVFVSCLLSDKIPNLRKKIALCGNPYLFDKTLGISPAQLQVLQNISLDNYLDFRRKYMVFSDEEYAKYNELQSLRSLESCQSELAYLQQLYSEYKDKIVPCFDKAIVAEEDLLFNLNAQKDFYKEKLVVIPKARHHIFFRFNSFEELLNT